MVETIFKNITELFYDMISDLKDWSSGHVIRILIIVLIAYTFKKFGSQIIIKVLEKTIRDDLYRSKSDRKKRIDTLDSLIGAVLKVTLAVIASVMIMSELGLNTTPVLASAGIVGVALGFGAQSLIKDITSGFFIIIENQYRVGDVIMLDNNVSGTVEAITMRTTKIRELDGTLYHIPNGTINWIANKTSNYSGIDENITFPNDVDIEKLAIVIDRTGRIISENPDLQKKIKTPPHFIRVVGFEPSGITVKVAGKTSSDNSWKVKGEFYKQLVTELRKSKIDLPYSHLTFINPNVTKKLKK